MIALGLCLVGAYPLAVAVFLTGALTTDDQRLSKILMAATVLSVLAGCAGAVLIVAGVIL